MKKKPCMKKRKKNKKQIESRMVNKNHTGKKNLRRVKTEKYCDKTD